MPKMHIHILHWRHLSALLARSAVACSTPPVFLCVNEHCDAASAHSERKGRFLILLDKSSKTSDIFLHAVTGPKNTRNMRCLDLGVFLGLSFLGSGTSVIKFIKFELITWQIKINFIAYFLQFEAIY